MGTRISTEPDWSRLRNFSRSEFVCKCGCGRAEMDQTFLERLDWLRELCGFPLIISSGYRCPDYNARVSKTGAAGPHVYGKAADIKVYGERAHKLLHYAASDGLLAGFFTGWGIAQSGPKASRFIHLDSLDRGYRKVRPWIWSY